MIRRLSPHDAQLLRSLRIRALGDAPHAFSSTLAETVARPTSEWEYMLRADGNPFFISEVGEEVHGIAAGLTPQPAGDAYLVSMWIDPLHRGRGVSDELVEHVIGWARSTGARRVALECTEGNLFAERLYVRHGFRRTGASSKRDRDGTIEFEMVLELSASGR